MKTDRNKNNVKSEENMILKKSRRSDANVFPVENKGKGKIAEAKKRQVKGVIWKTVLQQKWLSMGLPKTFVRVSDDLGNGPIPFTGLRPPVPHQKGKEQGNIRFLAFFIWSNPGRTTN